MGYLEQDPVLAPGPLRSVLGDGWEAAAVLERLGLGAAEAAIEDVSLLSGGQAKRVALAGVLARPAELLVLDEPTNHLDLAGVAWLEQQLLALRGGLVLVSHDRHLLDRVTTRILELDRGHRYIHEGGYASYLEARAARDEQAAATDAVRRNLARRELAWLRRGAPARTRKSQARIATATRLQQSELEAPARAGALSLRLGTPRLGNKVIECIELGFSYDATEAPVLSDVNLDLGPGDRLGVVGSNGSGKSTLLEVLAGRYEPTSGRIDVGSTVALSYYRQQPVDLDPSARVQDIVAGPHRRPGTYEDVALMERFWFTGDLPFAPVGTLSGGERRRLQLLVALAARPNVLLLDEPTNDLDLDTLRALEDFLDEWEGTLVAASHDRTFLERATDQLIEVSNHTTRPVLNGVEGWIATTTSTAGARRAGASPDSQRTTAHAATSERLRSPSTLSRLVRETERELTRLTRRRDELTTALAGTTEHAELAQIGRDLTASQAAIDDAEGRWLELAEELERVARPGRGAGSST